MLKCLYWWSLATSLTSYNLTVRPTLNSIKWSGGIKYWVYVYVCWTTLCLEKVPTFKLSVICQILTEFQNFRTAGKRIRISFTKLIRPASYGFCSKYHTLPAVQKFSKSVQTLRSYRQFKVGNFFLRQSVVLLLRCMLVLWWRGIMLQLLMLPVIMSKWLLNSIWLKLSSAIINLLLQSFRL